MRRMITLRKPNGSVLLILTLVFAAFTLGFFLGTHQNRSDITVSVSNELKDPPKPTEQTVKSVQKDENVVFPVNINRATAKELTVLPGIGDILAQRIIAYRNTNGYFSTEEELLNVEGIGKKRLEEIIELISIGG